MDNQHPRLPHNAKQIPNFSDYYVTPEGDIYSTKRQKPKQLTFFLDESIGYRRSTIVDDFGKKRSMLLHRLIAITFLGKAPTEFHEVNHIDGDKTNNALSNLEWVTRAENLEHAFTNGLKTVSGQNNPRSILSEKEVLEVYQKLLSGKSNRAVAKEYNISNSAIMLIKNKRNWNYLLKDLPDINIKGKSNKLPDDVVHKICLAYQNGVMPLEILDTYNTGATADQLWDIKRRRGYKEIVSQYVW